MKSHAYEFTLKEAALAVALPALPLLFFSLVMHGGARANLLPSPLPVLDTDRTILIHQAHASRQPDDASLLFIGDSSCLMNVSVPQLEQSLPGGISALNLGTLSYLDLRSFGLMLQAYVQANPGALRTAVLLMHPEALRRPAGVEYHAEVLQRFYAGADFCGPTLPPLLCALGIETFRGRLLSRAIPQPLPGAYGREYGFTQDLWDFLSANRGSAFDPGTFDPADANGHAEYRLAPALETASAAFRQTIPRGVKLVVGITPVPESLALEGYAQRHRAMLETWGRWLQTDAILTNLPAVLPDAFFASKTHLNERGVRAYTDQLARALSQPPLGGR